MTVNGIVGGGQTFNLGRAGDDSFGQDLNIDKPSAFFGQVNLNAPNATVDLVGLAAGTHGLPTVPAAFFALYEER